MDKNFLELVQRSKAKGLAGDQEPEGSALSQYETPLVTVDIVLFTVQDHQLNVLLIQRRNDPFKHSWAIPGGFLHVGEALRDGAKRHLREKTNVGKLYLEQLYTFGIPQRDPRARVITVSYYALISSEDLDVSPKDATNVVENIGWFSVGDLPPLAFDHKEIVEYALERLKERLETSSIAFQLLPEKFTLTELQRVYELILDRTLDKRNFRKKVLSSGIVKDIGETKMEGYHRPAQLYVFSKKPSEKQA